MVSSCLKDFLFPKKDILNGYPGSFISQYSLNSFKINQAQLCYVCGKVVNFGFIHDDCAEKSYLDGLIFFVNYNDDVGKIIGEGKYSGTFEVFSEIGQIMNRFVCKNYNLNDFVITSVPIHKSKFNKRGFNQAEIIAKAIGTHYELINRIKNTKTQVGMEKDERELNLQNVFQASDFLINNKIKKVLIVDDVYTTGTTLKLCSKILKENGVEEVVGLVFAKRG